MGGLLIDLQFLWVGAETVQEWPFLLLLSTVVRLEVSAVRVGALLLNTGRLGSQRSLSPGASFGSLEGSAGSVLGDPVARGGGGVPSIGAGDGSSIFVSIHVERHL